jgi:hypothetical protein
MKVLEIAQTATRASCRLIVSSVIAAASAGPDALPDDPGEAFADSVYRGSHFRAGDDAATPEALSGERTRAKGGDPSAIAELTAPATMQAVCRFCLMRIAQTNRRKHG